MKERQVQSKNYRNYVELSGINDRVRSDPEAFVEESEALYAAELAASAKAVAESGAKTILLSGPSSSGKTTTTKRLCQALQTIGVKAHHVELDNYFLDVDRSDPTIDLEAPERMDMALLDAHLDALEQGREVLIPHFDFTVSKRTQQVTPLRLHRDEVAVFEGIHALNDVLYQSSAHTPFAVYLSARMRVCRQGVPMVEPEWTRFVRRLIRDAQFRGTTPQRTQHLWPNVRRGELAYILPCKHRAQVMIDTSLDYELSVLAPLFLSYLPALDCQRLARDGMGTLPEMLSRFEPLPVSIVPQDSLLREFVGK